MVQLIFSIVILEFLISVCCATDATLSLPMKIVNNAGHTLQSHTVQTEDGYLLTMFRIPGPPGSTPIFLQHGILGSSDSWILIENDSLAIKLANLEYDVWLGNSRSSVYSRTHTILENTDEEFWNYSFHEIGTQDLPAMINYVTSNTGKNVIYMGFSMGTTSFFVMASEKPEMSSKIDLAFALAPIVYLDDLDVPNSNFAIKFFLGKKSFGSNSGWTIIPFKNKIAYKISKCSKEHIKENYLEQVLKVSFGTTSVKTIKHLSQQRDTGKFRQFDYGEKNFEIYNNSSPPEYNLKKIKIPVVLITSYGDVFSTPENVEKLYEQLPNVYGGIIINSKKICHFDFMYGEYAEKYIYEKIFDFLKKFEKEKRENIEKK
ncbi:lipase 3-like [Leptopilina boulardi]|uniref:lipase 3-like n=1 Tax=Leptopilina boulardi TaxID=63433 RepID=UPI0021F5A1F7|nr:lipase 3-like [Leptopilina boulardi]